MQDSKNEAHYSIKKIFKGASIYSIGELLVKASGLILLPIYTRVLSPKEYGILGLLQIYLQIGTVILAFGFYGAQTRFYYEHQDDTVSNGIFAFTINMVPMIFAFIVGIPITIIGIRLEWKIGASEISFYPYVVITLWAVILQVLANNAVSYYRTRQKFGIASFLQVSRFFAIACFSILFIVVWDLGAIGGIGGILAGIFVFLLFSFIGYVKTFVPSFSIKALIYAVSFGAPIVVHLLAGTLHNALDRIILERFVPLEDIGIYTLGFTIANALNLFIISFNQAFQPSYFNLMTTEPESASKNIIRTFNLWLYMITFIAFFGILLGGPFLSFFVGVHFIKAIKIFPWLILAVYLGGFYYFFSSPIFYFKKTKYLPFITGASALVNIMLNFLFIPSFGLFGAAFATIISHIVQSMIAYYFGNRLFPLKWPMSKIVIASTIVCISLFITIQIQR